MSDQSSSPAPGRDRLALATAIVLATAGLLSAWSGYQGAMWSGLEAEHFHASNALATESSELAIVARQREERNAAIFQFWLETQVVNQPVRAAFLERQFDPRFAAEFQRWRATLPADLREASPDTPRPRFEGLLAGPAKAAEAQSRAAAERARTSGDIADRYDRWTVFLATALFLAGIASVVGIRVGQVALVSLGGVLTGAALVALLLLPVSFGN
jgi:hypothetical protein